MNTSLGQFEKANVERYENGDGLFFTSDTHFCHVNIIHFCNRPYKDTIEMNQALVDNWNAVVKPEDTVYHLGDFCWGGSAEWHHILQSLNGHIHLILGNHDMKNMRQGYMNMFESVTFQKQIYVGNQCIYLNHYPFLCYGGSYRSEPVWQLFGHVHSQPKHYDIEHISDAEVKEILGKDDNRLKYLFPTQYDVGVDNNNYTPVSFYEVKTHIEAQINKSNQ